MPLSRTDRGPEFQARFHGPVADQGLQHIYLKPRSPPRHGKVERAHRTAQTEFDPRLTDTDEVDLNAKLAAWESFYPDDRPHRSHAGQTPDEVRRRLLNHGLALTKQTLSDEAGKGILGPGEGQSKIPLPPLQSMEICLTCSETIQPI